MTAQSTGERRGADRRKPQVPGETTPYFGADRRRGDRRANAAASEAERQPQLQPKPQPQPKSPPSLYEPSDVTRTKAWYTAAVVVGLSLLVMVLPAGIKLLVDRSFSPAPVATTRPAGVPPGLTAATAAVLAAQAAEAARAKPEPAPGWATEPPRSEPASPAFAPPAPRQPSEPAPSFSAQPSSPPPSNDGGDRPRPGLLGKKPL